MDLSLNNMQLGRLPSSDEKDHKFLLADRMPKKIITRTSRYWNANGWWGNQENQPHCVGFAWAHWVEDGPVTHKGLAPIANPSNIYYEAQTIDEWPGENYDGTSVRAGAKILQKQGLISEYRWAWELQTLIDSVLELGPVVVGTNWYEGMFYPDSLAFIKVTGRIAGGHAYVINGVNTKKKFFRIKNSWGREWGKKGHAFISFDDMSKLILEDGEVCIGFENQLINN